MHPSRRSNSHYGHLYDLVYLRTHPLLDVLVSDLSLPSKARALHLHRLLLDVIEELRPSPQASAFSRQAREYRLLVLRYVKAMDPKAVAAELAVGRRHYYREHRDAMGSLTGLLWDRHCQSVPTSKPWPSEDSALRHLELLRLEAARTAQADHCAQVEEVVHRLLPLLQELMQQHDLQVRPTLEQHLPRVSIDGNLLRQVLLGTFGYLIEAASHASIDLSARTEGSAVCLSLKIEPAVAARLAPSDERQARLANLSEMATVAGISLRPLEDLTLGGESSPLIVGFEVRLPATVQTVLVVDDNADTRELFQRYLSPHHYRVVTARNGQEALDLAQQIIPRYVTLDLMMPGKDGWDVLQALLNQPSTRHIPVIVCTVLRQKELAISLGATAFLEKPVSEQALLQTLQAIGGGKE